MIRKIEIERFSLTTSKRFDEVIAGVNAAIGHPDMAEFGRSTHEARSSAEPKSAVEKGLSRVLTELEFGARAYSFVAPTSRQDVEGPDPAMPNYTFCPARPKQFGAPRATP
jgi:hypothetical protein